MNVRIIFRAEDRARTGHPDLGKVVLYQMSYFRNYCKNLSFFSDGKNKGCIATTKIFIYILGCTGYFQAHLPLVCPCNDGYINYNSLQK
jgi:hypothetical protein